MNEGFGCVRTMSEKAALMRNGSIFKGLPRATPTPHAGEASLRSSSETKNRSEELQA